MTFKMIDDAESLVTEKGIHDMWKIAETLFPIHRSLAGPGVLKLLRETEKFIPITVHEYNSGDTVGDWALPDEWEVKEAYIENMRGERIVDFAENQIHLMGYSSPIDKVVTREELEPHLFSKPALPQAIPYVDSYYRPN